VGKLVDEVRKEQDEKEMEQIRLEEEEFMKNTYFHSVIDEDGELSDVFLFSIIIINI
jgi:hypothetical protein